MFYSMILHTAIEAASGTVIVEANEAGKPCTGDAEEEITCSGLVGV